MNTAPNPIQTAMRDARNVVHDEKPAESTKVFAVLVDCKIVFGTQRH
jgi:hypothetical protein